MKKGAGLKTQYLELLRNDKFTITDNGIVENETGEIFSSIEEVVQNQMKEVIEKQNRQKDGYKLKKQLEIRRGSENFYNIFTSYIDYLIQCDFTDCELGYSLYIGRFTDYYEKYEGEQYIRMIKSCNSKKGMKNKDIRKVIGLIGKKKDQTWQNLKNKWISHGVLYEDESGYFYMNKNFAFKGKSWGDDKVKAKIQSTNETKMNFKKSKELGLILKIMQYISCVNMCLVENPKETRPNKLIYIQTLKRLREVTGIDRDAYRRLFNMRINNMCVISEVKNNKGKRFMLNHKIFYKGDYGNIENVLLEYGLDTSTIF